MDWESWWRFEAHAVALFSDAPDPLSRLGLAVDRLCAWSVDRGSLTPYVDRAFEDARRAEISPQRTDAATVDARSADALAAVPPPWRDEAEEALSAPPCAPPSDQAWRRFMAAHAFANWTAYLGDGLHAWYRSVETAACLLERTGDPGRVDLVLRHLADARALTSRWCGQSPRSASIGFTREVRHTGR
jgi:hypothetical protein